MIDPQDTPDAAENIRAHYDPVTARRRLARDTERRMTGAVYNPFSDSARRIHTQAIRPLTPRKSLALYLYLMFVMLAVTFVWMWALTPLRQILPSTM